MQLDPDDVAQMPRDRWRKQYMCQTISRDETGDANSKEQQILRLALGQTSRDAPRTTLEKSRSIEEHETERGLYKSRQSDQDLEYPTLPAFDRRKLENHKFPLVLRQPSPDRISSSKDRVEQASRPAVRRLGPNDEYNERRPPTLDSIKMHIPEKQRSTSVQMNSDAPSIRPVQRSETMPARRSNNTVPTRSGVPNPAYTPDEQTVPPHKFPYGRQYADDNEVPTPDGYRTETREPEKVPTLASTRRKYQFWRA